MSGVRLRGGGACQKNSRKHPLSGTTPNRGKFQWGAGLARGARSRETHQRFCGSFKPEVAAILAELNSEEVTVS